MRRDRRHPHRQAGRHQRRRRGGRHWFLVAFTALVVLATIGSSALITRDSDRRGEYAPSVAGRASASTGQAPAATAPGSDGESSAPGSAPTRSTPTGTAPTGTPPTLTAQSGGPTPTATAIAAVDAMSTADALDIGAAALDRRTGQLDLSGDGATAFYSASVVKLFTVVDILQRVETGQASITVDQRDDMQRALSVSDDDAMNALWDEFGGASTVTELVGLAHLQDTQPPADPGEWGETLVSARDVVAVYQYLLTSLSPADQQLMMGALSSAGDTGADGFNQDFGLLGTPRLAGVAAKQGWMVDGSSEYLHSVGVFGTDNRYVIAVLTKQPASRGYDAGKADVTTAVAHLTGAVNELS